MLLSNNEKNLLAILGPTNTGKTHLAFDRLIYTNLYLKYTKIAKLRSQGKITQSKFDSELKKILK